MNTFPEGNRVGSDPKAIAFNTLPFLGLPEGDFQEHVRTAIYGKAAVVILTRVDFADDSVRGVKYRLEFSPTYVSEQTTGSVPGDQSWQLVWIGRQQICQQGRGSQTWSKELCR
ncbi:MAG: hypothetical protein HC851_14840 [Acaryochloris sp. RU_4_1]|nr:hypothetical protein [Acaryochloris sp. RU_4_1]NJR56167.1 hypothetical protein [Acaryochloris sp. CRU_2_0]